MVKSESPGGHYRLCVSAWEASNSLWVESPTLTEIASGEQLLAIADTRWSLDSAQWLDDSVVRLMVRKFPGNHVPGQVAVKVDCAARTAEVAGVHVEALAQVEHYLDRAIEWVHVAPPTIPQTGGLSGLFRRLFGG